MKRRAIEIVLFLLLGAIVNVAVAWTFARFVDMHPGGPVASSMRITDGSAVHTVKTFARWGAIDYSSERNRATSEVPSLVEGDKDLLRRWPDFSEPLEGFRNGTLRIEARDARLRGWPMLALWGETRKHLQADGKFTDFEACGSMLLASGGGKLHGWHVFPLRPLWPGFAINTMFYAALLWLPFAVVGRLRRRRRIRRGLCPACAYDLRGVGDSAVCTECGGKVNPAVRMAR